MPLHEGADPQDEFVNNAPDVPPLGLVPPVPGPGELPADPVPELIMQPPAQRSHAEAQPMASMSMVMRAVEADAWQFMKENILYGLLPLDLGEPKTLST